MSFTWTGDPSASIIEEIRFLIDDRDESKPKFNDEEINFAYEEEGSIYGAAAMLCEQLATRYADAVNRALGPLRVDLSDKSNNYANRAAQLRKRAVAYAKPYVGGISLSKKEEFDADSDLIQPIFDKEMMKNG
jgi:hypothetical protein